MSTTGKPYWETRPDSYHVGVAVYEIIDPNSGEVVAERYQVLSDWDIERIQALPVEPPYHYPNSIGRASFISYAAYLNGTRVTPDGVRFLVE